MMAGYETATFFAILSIFTVLSILYIGLKTGERETPNIAADSYLHESASWLVVAAVPLVIFLIGVGLVYAR